MCGRFSLAYQTTDREYDEYFKRIMQAQREAKPRYNIAPTQTSPIIRVRDGEPVCEEVKWGLYENWWAKLGERKDKEADKDKAKKKRPGIDPQINARGETVFTNGLFRNSAKSRRCLVLATGWYEWMRVKGRKGAGDPFAFGMKDKRIMLFAGIWTTKYLEKDVGQDNYAIITTDPTPLAAKVHNRMPVILHEKQAMAWLDPEYKDLEKLEGFLAPYKGRDLVAYQVGSAVNNVRNIGKDCLQPLN